MDAKELLDCYHAMVIGRAIEEACIGFSGHWYAGVGEEAAVVGAYWAAESDDVIYPHYRGALVVHWMRGRPIEDIFRSVLSRKGVSSRGRHIAPFDGHLDGNVMPYVSVMLGPNIAFGAGAAMALERRTESAIALVGFGDGTAGTGDFHETMNLASVLRLPVVFMCQNNQFSISTPARTALACDSVADWARGYGLPASSVDGNDLVAVTEAISDGITRARAREGPSFVECLTYRRTGHFAADPARYRDDSEVDAWAAKDPLIMLATKLEAEYGVDPQRLRQVDQEARTEVAEAAQRASDAPSFTAADLELEGVYEHELEGGR